MMLTNYQHVFITVYANNKNIKYIQITLDGIAKKS